MIEPRVSVIIPTHNRPEKLAETLSHLIRQNIPASVYEVIVVDDGSSPPVTLPTGDDRLRLLRLGGGERSAARNAGAAAARGDLLIFVDDDISVREDHLDAFLRAHHEWPQALLIGAIRLSNEAAATPFGRFRQRLEDQGVPRARGLTSISNFCAAANMAISLGRFNELGGFDREIASGEDQDFALRHTALGGQIAFVPDARVVHRDSALDLKSYGRRNEWGSRMMLPFCRRYPELLDNLVREETNGPIRWSAEPFGRSVRKLIKSFLALSPILSLLNRPVSLLEGLMPNGALLDRLYSVVLGIYIFRGYRQGLQTDTSSHDAVTPDVAGTATE